MKILFVANRVPYPPFRGDKLKIYNLARRLAQHHELYLITFAENENEREYEAPLKEIFREIRMISLPRVQSYFNCLLALFSNIPLQVAYFRSKQMTKEVGRFIQTHEIDVIHTQHLRMAQFTKDIMVPKILDLPDAFSLYWKRRIANRANPLMKFFEKVEYRRLYAFEGNITPFYNLSLVCSAEDLEYLRQEHHAERTALLRNGVDLSNFHPDPGIKPDANTILFTGNMDYAPNVDGVLYFAREIFPKIKASVPEARFIVAGQRPVKKVRELHSGDIMVTGFVPDLKIEYQKAWVVVSPLRFGAGTQNKVLEAMSMGIPVVSGPIGFKGLEIENGEGVFLETDPDGFANKVIEILHSPALREKTGSKGMEIASVKFDWDIIASQLEGYFRQVI